MYLQFKLSIILSFICIWSNAQTQKEAAKTTDHIIARTESLYQLNRKSFLLSEVEINKGVIGELWNYYMDSNVTIFNVNYNEDSTSYIEKYYLMNNQLIYAEETEATYFPVSLPKDSIMWRGSYYFSNNKMIYYETSGHGKSETKDWNPEKDVPAQFKKRFLQFKGKIN